MNKVLFFVHAVVLMLIQLLLLDNIQVGYLLYINIYLLIILMVPDEFNKTFILILGFAIGMIIDIANNTMGIHTAATTLLAYIRPNILQSINSHQQNPIKSIMRSGNNNLFLKYISISTILFSFILIFLEVFSFRGFFMTILRVLCSAIVSIVLMMLYYHIALRTKNHE